MAIFFTSDIHITDDRPHKLRGSKRFFADRTDWHELIRERWNSKIQKDDTVYIIGDVDRKSGDVSYIQNLNGNKILIKGNHDDGDNATYSRYFKEIHEKFLILDDVLSIPVYLTHKPEDYNPEMFNLVGHIHDTWKYKTDMINVGLDAWGCVPISQEEMEYAIDVVKNYLDKNDLLNEVIPKKRAKCKLEKFVFLGGTVTKGLLNWRIPLIELIDCEYFNPLILDRAWSQDDEKIENEKKKVAKIELYHVDRTMEGIYSISEVTNACHNEKKKVIFSYNREEMSDRLVSSLESTSRLLKSINKDVEIIAEDNQHSCLKKIANILNKG